MKEKKDRRLVAVRRIFFFPWLLEFLLVLIRKGEEEEKKRGKRKFDFQIFSLSIWYAVTG